MSAVAKAMGIPLSTLYRHFSSRDELTAELCRDKIREFSLPQFDGVDWKTWLKRSAMAIWSFYVDNPLLLRIESADLQTELAAPIFVAVFDVLDKAGFSPEESLHMYTALAAIIQARAIGEVLQRDLEDVYQSQIMGILHRSGAIESDAVRAALPHFGGFDNQQSLSKSIEYLVSGFPEPPKNDPHINE
jgi:AcrR family transcriptional regulator